MKKLLLIALFNVPVVGFCGGSLTNNATNPRHISMGNTNNVINGSLTVFVWTKASALVANEGIIGKKSDLTAGTSGYFIYKDVGRVFHGIVADGVTLKDCNTGVSNTGNWTNLIMTFNGTSDNVVLYENEIAACGSIVGTIGSITNTNNFKAGNHDSNTINFTGNLAYAGFFNSVLTPYERAEIRWKPMSYATTGSRSYWSFWGSSATEPDYGSTSITGTRTGFAEDTDGPPVMIGGAPL